MHWFVWQSEYRIQIHPYSEDCAYLWRRFSGKKVFGTCMWDHVGNNQSQQICDSWQPDVLKCWCWNQICCMRVMSMIYPWLLPGLWRWTHKGAFCISCKACVCLKSVQGGWKLLGIEIEMIEMIEKIEMVTVALTIMVIEIKFICWRISCTSWLRNLKMRAARTRASEIWWIHWSGTWRLWSLS